MNVGIVTFHCSYNFGSALQAFALKRFIEMAGHNVSVIDYRSKDFDSYRLVRTDSIETCLVSIVSLVRYRAITERSASFEAFQRDFLHLSDKRYTYRFEEEMSELSDQFDCFVCGSDQIWNLDCTAGPVAPYFLSFAGDKKRIAYAPSLAHTAFAHQNFTEEDRQFIGRQLDRFSAVSVREASTVQLFQPLTQNRIEVCLDPTLLLDADDYEPIVSSSAVSDASYVFVYMLEHNSALNKQAENVARRLGVEIRYVSKWNQHFSVPSKNCYGVGPKEFLGLVRGASAVITNSFHATVFSLLFGVPFQTLATQNSGSRMRELLQKLGEQDHLIDGETAKMPVAVDEDALGVSLEALRFQSEKFLCDALRD